MYKIEKVSPEVVRPLRHKVLRPHLPFEASCLPSDNDPDAIHFTLKKDDTILSVASLYSESLEAMPNNNTFRLRVRDELRPCSGLRFLSISSPIINDRSLN